MYVYEGKGSEQWLLLGDRARTGKSYEGTFFGAVVMVWIKFME